MGRDIHVVLERKTPVGWEYFDPNFTAFDGRHYCFLGHWPHWVPVDEASAADQWFIAAKANTPGELTDGTYEAIGPHFNGNPHQLEQDVLVRHGEKIIQLENRSFEGIRAYLEQHCIEGIVFWKDGIPGCKIKRRDFGFDWPYKK